MIDNLTILLIGTSGMLLLIAALIYFAYSYQNKLTKKEAQVREIQELLKSEELKTAYALLEGQDKERQRVANDLHDRMGGQLSTVKIYLDLLEKTELNDKQQGLMDKLQRSAQVSIEEVRAIAHDLNSSTLSYYGLQKAVEHLCEVISESKRVKVTHHIEIQQDLKTELMRDLYHVIQELMTNTLRHAGARNIHLEINVLKEGTNLIYEDDGEGFNQNEKKIGIGLRSIQMRAERYGGSLTIDGRKGKGASFILEIPVQDE